jgi:hypothetical protein
MLMIEVPADVIGSEVSISWNDAPRCNTTIADRKYAAARAKDRAQAARARGDTDAAALHDRVARLANPRALRGLRPADCWLCEALATAGQPAA